MSELSKNYKKIIQDVENHIQDPELLEYVKTQLCKLSMIFLDQLDKVLEISENKIEDIIESQKELNQKMSKIESSVEDIEKDIYFEEEGDTDVVCPYCNSEFLTYIDDSKMEIVCPECNNAIELDWGTEEMGCSRRMYALPS